MFRRILVSFVLFATVLPSAWSQDCVPAPGPSILLKTNEAVFVGTVTGATGGTYQLHVTEAFKGVTGGAFAVEAVAGMSFTGFQMGKQYLVFAYTLIDNDGTRFHLARGCGLTQELKHAQATLEQVRAEKNGQRVAPVYGMLLRTFPETLAWGESYEQGSPGIVVRLRSGTKTYRTKTDENGVYTFGRLPPGTYQVSADLPPDLALGDRISDKPPSPFELPRNSSFDYELYALPTGQIRGYVVGPDGKPVPSASVELYRADLFALDRQGYFASQVDGKPFKFRHLPPGDYVLVFNRQNFTSPDAPFQRTFYLGATNAQNATAIHLSDGQQISDADIHVKDPIPTRKITVQLHWNGRTPSDYYPPQVIVAASEGQDPFPFNLAPDTYSANLFVSARYTIRAQTSCRGRAKGMVGTNAVTINGADTSVLTVDLTFGKGECPPK
ncbi:MAG: collagen binding domain-containing protein [Candidatus Acidiferrales bacterium]